MQDDISSYMFTFIHLTFKTYFKKHGNDFGRKKYMYVNRIFNAHRKLSH